MTADLQQAALDAREALFTACSEIPEYGYKRRYVEEEVDALCEAYRALGRAEASEVVGEMLDREYAKVDVDPERHTPLSHTCLVCARYGGISEAYSRLTGRRRQSPAEPATYGQGEGGRA